MDQAGEVLSQAFTLKRGKKERKSVRLRAALRTPERQSRFLMEAGGDGLSILSKTGNFGEGGKRYDYPVLCTPVS